MVKNKMQWLYYNPTKTELENTFRQLVLQKSSRDGVGAWCTRAPQGREGVKGLATDPLASTIALPIPCRDGIACRETKNILHRVLS